MFESGEIIVKEDLRYIGFISYRHCDLDKYVAETLHTLIETYKMPKPVVEKYNITDNNIRRVFRDEEELPLSGSLNDSIYKALKESKFLIVICSPRLKESIWCKKEIQNFIKLHGRNNILCVLIEGEPCDSFPEELMYYEEKVKTKNGKEKINKISCEPLAMDVRGNSKKEVYNKLKKEIIRVIAPMYNLNYDDIKRRHEERELKRKVRLFRMIALISIIFTIYSTLLFLKIYISSNQLKYDQAISLADLSREKLLKDDRKGAIESAYQSLTEYKNNKMRITTNGIYELTESLGVYYISNNYYPISQLNTKGIIDSVKLDLDKKYLLSYDNSRELILWNLENEKNIKTIYDFEIPINENKYTFIGNKAFAYQYSNKVINVLNLNGEKINEIKLNFVVDRIVSSINGKYLSVLSNNKIFIYDTSKYEVINSYELSNKVNVNNIYFDDIEENIVIVLNDKNDEDKQRLLTYNISKNRVINEIYISSNKIVKVIFKDSNLIVLSNRKDDLTSNMLITNYNYKTGKIYFRKEYKKELPLDISMKYLESNKTLLVSSFGTSYLIDFNTGNEKTRFSIGNKVINSYSLDNSDNYILFTSNGETHIINGVVSKLNDVDNDVVYKGLYNFNLSNYEKYLYSSIGILAYVNNGNRIIIYGKLKNEDIKKIDYKERTFNSLNSSEKKSIIEEYKFKKKNLITNIVSSLEEKLLFVSYTDNTLEIYDNNKKLLNTVDGIKNIEAYIGKTSNNEYLIREYTRGYILNKNFELIGYVPWLYDYHDNKMILKADTDFYEIKIYNDKELINIAKNKLKEEK